MYYAEESLRVTAIQNKEGFLALLGMTNKKEARRTTLIK